MSLAPLFWVLLIHLFIFVIPYIFNAVFHVVVFTYLIFKNLFNEEN